MMNYLVKLNEFSRAVSFSLPSQVWLHVLFSCCKALYRKDCYCCLVAKLCWTLLRPHGLYSSPDSVHGISQARILEWVAISFSKRSSQPRAWTQISCIGRQILYHWGTREAHTEKTPSYKCRLRLIDFCDTEEIKYWRKGNFISFCIYLSSIYKIV